MLTCQKSFVDLRLLKPSDSTSPFTELDWGIGGRSVGSGNQGKWVHDIDSRTLDPEPDAGQMSPHPTLPDVTLERGTMRHPESGEVREYEEAWKHIPILPVPCGGPYDGKVVSMFLESGAEGEHKRGMICRVGQYVQGIVRDGDAVSVQRWAWSEEEREWRNVARIGDAPMVCEATWTELFEGPGDSTIHDGVLWRVRSLGLTSPPEDTI